MTLFLCQDRDTVWTKSRAEGFKWWVTEKWMEEPRVQSPDLRTTTFMIIKTPPSTGNQIKLNALSLCMTSVLHLPCPAIRILRGTIFFTVWLERFSSGDTSVLSQLWLLTQSSMLLCSLENLKVTSIPSLWPCGTKSCLLLSHTCLCADSRTSWLFLGSQA